MPRRATIALVGLRCSGKSVSGAALAELLGLPFLDLDVELLEDARHAGFAAESAGALLQGVGQRAFRGFEASALRRILEPSQRVVLATGAGAVELASNRGWLRRAARCFWLRASVATLHDRMRSDDALRPALSDVDPMLEMELLLKRREAHYRSLSELSLDTEVQNPSELAQALVQALRDPASA